MTMTNDYPDSIVAEKRQLRIRMSRLRDRLHSDSGDISARICERFHESWTPAAETVISAFFPIQSEVDLRPLFCDLHERGCAVVLPVMVAKRAPLAFRLWTPATNLVRGQFGVPIPPEGAPTRDPDWLLVPFLAYDEQGFRLGYGGGFYDITLANLRRRKWVFAIGVGYDGQRVDRVPVNSDDARLDALLTERRMFLMEGCSGAGSVPR